MAGGVAADGTAQILSRDGRSIWKFQGHGHYGESVHHREQLLSHSGFGVPYLGRECGFGAHHLVAGRAAIPQDASSSLLRRVAEYCAWRAQTIGAPVSSCDIRELASMVTNNLEAEFGWSPQLNLEVICPVICDNRMQPSRWRLAGVGRWLKLDGASHGDDHFFPGPTDIAWDLAGVSVEWNLGAEARTCLLTEYQRLSGDDPGPRLADYELAYATFRMTWSKMAAYSIKGSDDAPRLWQQYLRYRTKAKQLLEAHRLARSLAA